MLFHTAVIRSGYMMQNSVEFADQIETMLRLSMNVDLDEKVRVGGRLVGWETESCRTVPVCGKTCHKSKLCACICTRTWIELTSQELISVS